MANFNTKKLKKIVLEFSNFKLDRVNIWEYIEREEIEIVPLYFSKTQGGFLPRNILLDDRFKVSKKDQIENLNDLEP